MFSRKIILPITISLVLVACGSTPYKKSGWANSNPESDWDLDSAICLQKSQTLSSSDLERIKEIKLANQTNQALIDQQMQQVEPNQYSGAINAIGALGVLFFKSNEVTAEEDVKEENFEKCLRDKSWEKSE